MVFLPSSAPARPRRKFSSQPPVVRAEEPEFLIEASAAYPKLESLALDARSSLRFAFRIFDPDTVLRHPRTRALGLETWGDLIAYKLDRGVSFRLLLTDFDPVVGDTLHEDTWRAVHHFYARQEKADTPWDMQVLPAQHQARAGRYIRLALAPAIYARINAKRRELNALPPEERAETFQYLRGYHRYLRLARSGVVQWRPKLILPRIYPVTHHHKLAVFDDETVILGGLDVNERRYDTPEHDRPAPETWHDVSLCVTGAVAAHAARYIADVWNVNRKAAIQSMIRAKAQYPRLFGCLVPDFDILDPPPAVTMETGPVPMQLIRTVSRRSKVVGFRMRPKTVDSGIEDAYFALIREARRLLYVETQFFRHRPLADALAARARECPDLRLILLLPAAPEEIAFDDKNGLDSRYGEHLQADCIEVVRKAFGERVLFVSPAKREYTPDEGRGILNHAPIIYVHAKVAVADDAWGIVGSANMNGRSMKWDSELALLWNSPSAGALRRQLSTDWIDAEAGHAPMEEAFDIWKRTAVENARRNPAERRGFILPYFADEASALGMSLPLPPELV